MSRWSWTAGSTHSSKVSCSQPAQKGRHDYSSNRSTLTRTMSFSKFIADRYLRSSRNAGFVSFITAIATMGVMLGTATLIIALAVLGGFEREITEKVIGFTSHVQVIGFQNLPLENPRETVDLLEKKLPLVQSASPYVARDALIRSREGVDGILLKGLDPAHDNSAIRRYMVGGSYALDRIQGGLAPLVIGRKLAARLSVEVGDKVAIFG